MQNLSKDQKKSVNEQKDESSQVSKNTTLSQSEFIEPKLTKHGDATKITAGFFGTFAP